jgi:hypothetical protein
MLCIPALPSQPFRCYFLPLEQPASETSGTFNNTEFLMLTLISMTQAIVAILINARTLRRTIGVGDN